MCDTSPSRTAIVTLTLCGVYDQQQHPEHETSSGEPALMRLERGHSAGEGRTFPLTAHLTPVRCAMRLPTGKRRVGWPSPSSGAGPTGNSSHVA